MLTGSLDDDPFLKARYRAVPRLMYIGRMRVASGTLIASLGRRLPDQAPLAVLGVAAGVLSGLAVSHVTEPPGAILVGLVAVLGLTPLALALGRYALPAWIALFGLLYPFARFPAEAPVVTLDRLFLAALALALLLAYRHRAAAAESAWMQRSLVLLAAVFLLSAVSTPGLMGNVATWIDAFLLPLIVFLAAREAARDRRGVASVAAALAFAGTAIALIGLAQRFAGLDLTQLIGASGRFDAAIGALRISGPFAAPEPFALVLLSCFAGTLLWIRWRGPAVLLPGAIAVAVQLTAIALTYFRAAWLGAVLVCLLVFVGGQPSRWRRVGAVAAATVGLALAFVLASGNEEVGTRLQDERNVTGRFATYQRGVELFSRNAVSGVGFQRFEDAVRQVPQTSFEGVRALDQAHSSIVSTLAEQGLIGFLPLLASALAFALVLRALWFGAADPADRWVAICGTGAALAYLVMSATLTMIYYGPSNAMIAAVAGLACGRLDTVERPSG